MFTATLSAATFPLTLPDLGDLIVVEADSYLDGATPGNTVRAPDFGTGFWGSTATSNNDGLWRERAYNAFKTNYENLPGATDRVYELGSTDRINAPALQTTVNGLPAENYEVFLVYTFRNDGNAANAGILASLDRTVSTSDLYSHANVEEAVAGATGTWGTGFASLGVTGSGATDFFVEVQGTTRFGRNDYIAVAYQVSTRPAFELTVNRDTGAMTLSNNGGGAATILGYSITSTADTLDPSLWKSIAGNWDKIPDGDGSVDPDDAWTRFTNPASRNDLSEGELDADGAGNGATIAGNQEIDLGTPWIRYPNENIQVEFLMEDGSKTSIIATFVGNGDKAFLLGDFNFNNLIDDDDYLILRDGLQTDLSALSATEAYSFGDINGDSANNYTDTVLFRAAYDDANGVGSFDAMIASVPEPTSLALLGLGGVALLFLRRGRSLVGNRSTLGKNRSMHMFHRTLLGLAMVSGLTLGGITTNANAESLLFDVNDFAAGSPTQAGWIAADTEGVNSITFAAVGEGVTVDDRDRTDHGGGAEPDMWRDFIFANGSNVAGDDGLDVTVSNLLADTTYYVAIWAYDNSSNADLEATWTGSNGGTSGISAFDGRLPPPNDLRDYRLDITAITDGSGVLTLEGRAGPKTHTHSVFVNGIEISDEPLPPTVLTLEINTDTGATRILNESTYATDINYYEITSETKSLDPDGWNSLDDQNFGASGPGIGESWDEAGGSDTGTLTEIYFHSSTNLLDQEVLNLGSAFKQAGGEEDIQFNYGLTNGKFASGFVTYVTGSDENGDFDGSGAVKQGDLDLVLLNWGQEAPPEWVNQRPDGNVGNVQLDLVRTNWGNTYSAVAATSVVPEPTSLGLLGLAIAGLAMGWIRRPRV